MNSISGALFSFNTPSYTTHASHNSKNNSFTFDLKPGLTSFPFTNVAGSIIGSMNKMSIVGERNMKAIGYLHSDKADHRTHLMDFNREKDGPYYLGSKILPLTNVTYDTYSVLGQGVGGVYRPHRNQIGYVSDPIARSSEGIGAQGGLELGVPTFPIAWKTSASLGFSFIDSYSGLWRNNNTGIGANGYGYDKAPTSVSSTTSLYEKSFFKRIGELTSDNGRFQTIKGEKAIAPKNIGHQVNDEFSIPENGGVTESITKTFNERSRRNQPLSALNLLETTEGGLIQFVEDYEPGIQITADNQLAKNVDLVRNRIAKLDIELTQLYELTITKPDGMRYVYGLPVYNKHQMNATFNVHANTQNSEFPGSVLYTDEDLTNNSKGQDHFSSVEEMPAYAYAHLLTAVVSSDYIDYTEDGPTDDDYGTWVKFNYSRVKPKTEVPPGPNDNPVTFPNTDYHWKFPYADNHVANLNEGFKSFPGDDKANFISGEKEIWTLHSVESKNHIAVFFTDDRSDGFGVASDGAVASEANRDFLVAQQKLTKIEYYAKNDLLFNATDATPLKTVHFEYDYSLCQGIPNKLSNDPNYPNETGTGKLTLKKLYFTYGKSLKGQYNKYKFNYDGLNPDYHRKAQDRWGCYKEELHPANDYNPLNIGNVNPLSNSDNPYAVQDATMADSYATAWNMTSIDLPSGGRIEVEYESDDYAFVQDKRAGQMFTLAGISNSKKLSDLQKAVTGDPNYILGSALQQNNVLIVDIDDALLQGANPENTLDENFRHLFIPENNLLYFRSLVDLKDGKYEFVPGYAKVLEVGTFTPEEDTNIFGYIELKGVGINDDEADGRINPIVKAALNFTRLNLPHLIWPEKDPGSSTFGFIQSLVTLLTKEPGRFSRGLNNSLLVEGFARSLVLNKSFIRLNNPNYAKKGGGCRVKKIAMSDGWTDMTGAKDNVYGHQYFYKKKEVTQDGSTQMISSGVATYEPMLGNDENPLKQPITISVNRTLAPDDDHYVETPLGESFYPSASVGYSEVTVAATRPSPDIIRTATGYSKTRFYTVRDFPYETKKNSLPAKRDAPSILPDFFNFTSEDKLTASMGYAIILNDMHGKPRESWTYRGALDVVDSELVLSEDVQESKISGTRYHYRLDDDGNLDNVVPVVYADGQVGTETLGIESEMALDYRENKTRSYRVNVSVNIDNWIISIFPPIFATAVSTIPSFNTGLTRFRSAVATKLVNKHGLLDRVEVHRNGSIMTTKNEYYDAVTGEVLLTSVNNEYQNKNDATSTDNLIYNMSYPAHWVYSGMAQSSTNIGAELYVWYPNASETSYVATDGIICDEEGTLLNLDHREIFHEGDEVTYRYVFKDQTYDEFVSSYRKLWVESVTADHVQLIDDKGKLFYTSNINLGQSYEQFVSVKIVRSGHRNQQSIPVAALTSMENPVEKLLNNPSVDNDGAHLKVLDFSCQEFDDDWNSYCREGEVLTSENCFYNITAIDGTTNVQNQGSLTLPPTNAWYSRLNFGVEAQNVNEECESIIPGSQEEILFLYQYVETPTYDLDAIQGLMIEEVKIAVDIGGTVEYQIVPLLPTTAHTTGHSNVYALDLIFENNEAAFESALKNSIANFLVNTYSSASIQNILFGADVIIFEEGGVEKLKVRISAICSQDISEYIEGIDKNDTYIKTQNPITNSDISNITGTYCLCTDGVTTLPELCKTYDTEIDFMCEEAYDLTLCNFNELHLASDKLNFNFIVSENPIACSSVQEVHCNVESNFINPFLEGQKGNWRPSRSWVHKNVARVQSDVSSQQSPTQLDAPQPEASSYGYYKTFNPFWNKPATAGPWTRDDQHYTLVSEVTQYNPYGEAIESRDALGIYSSAILGYDDKLAIAVGNNTEYRDFAYDGFEEYAFPYNSNQCVSKLHFDLQASGQLTEAEVHTGFYSLEIKGGDELVKEVAIDCYAMANPPNDPDFLYWNPDCACIPDFNPTSGDQRFVIDLWVKGTGQLLIRQANAASAGTDIPLVPQPDAPIIEGWQRIYEFIDLDEDTETLVFTFTGQDQTTCYFDDFRIYPFDANMKSFVYHPASLKLMAELDENNHATFYEYDEEWNLIRVKKETERGVYTLQENVSHVRRQN